MAKLTKYVLLLCLVGSSITAQIPGKRDSLAARVFTNLKLPTTGSSSITTAIAYQKLNDAQTPVCQDFDAFQKIDTLAISSSSEGATLPADLLRIESVEKIVWFTSTGNVRVRGLIALREVKDPEATTVELSDYNQADSSKPNGYRIKGTKLSTVPRNKKVATSPDSLLVTYWAIGHNLTSSTDSIDIHPDYREALILKATALLWRVRQGAASPEAAACDALYDKEVVKFGRKK